jgi:hypothetical protein
MQRAAASARQPRARKARAWLGQSSRDPEASRTGGELRAAAGRSASSRADAGAHSAPRSAPAPFVADVIGSVVAAGFPIWDADGPGGGVRVWSWPRPGGAPLANLQWNLHDRLQLEDENGFPVMELVRAVNQVLGLALEMQGFEVRPFDTEILVTPGRRS